MYAMSDTIFLIQFGMPFLMVRTILFRVLALTLSLVGRSILSMLKKKKVTFTTKDLFVSLK